jgi:ribosomal protein S18 acetylase RimI-like enzyme
MHIRRMTPAEINRIGEVNRAETVTAIYEPRPAASGFDLVAVRTEHDPPKELPPWSEEGVQIRAEEWGKHLERGGRLFGAFDSDRLAGFVLLGAKRADGSIELVALFVDRDQRRKGIATRLMDLAEEQALAQGAEAMFLYANPTVSAVDFYRSTGFQIAGLISKTVVRSLPGDVIMAKRL